MAYTDNNHIIYNSFDGNIFSRGKKVSNEQFLGATVDDLSDIASENGGKLPTTINGLEIDWNGAVLPNANFQSGGSLTINSTGDLLNGLKALATVGGYSEVILRWFAKTA